MSASGAQHAITLLSLGAACGGIAFVALAASAHVARREFARASTPLSVYFSEPTRAAMFAAYAALGVALACTAAKILLPGSDGVSGVAAASGVLLLVAAACLMPIALTTCRRFDSDERSTLRRALHRILTQVAFVAVVAAMLAFSTFGMPAATRGERALRVAAVLVSVFAAMLFALALRLPPGSPQSGSVQKLLVGMVVAWVFLCALA